jgi:type IX secretion system PorP/SprF family membrane protein
MEQKRGNISGKEQKKNSFLLLVLPMLLMSIILILSIQTVKSQDLDYTQYSNNPTYYNPANVGLTIGLKSRLNYRKQWTGLSGDYHSYSFSADIAERSLPGAGGIGIIATQSLAGKGLLKTNMIGFMPSVRIPISRKTIFQLGALASVVTQQLNWDNIVLGDQLDPRFGNIKPSDFTGPANEKVVYPDFAFGGIFQFQGYNLDGNIGAAVHHITKPNQSYFDINSRLPRKFVYNLDFVITITEESGYYSKRRGFKLNPGAMVIQQLNMVSYSVGMNIYMSHVYLGLWYRNQSLEYDEFSNLTVMAGMNIPFDKHSKMKLMYSYEMNINAQYSFTGPSHQVTLIFEFDEIGLISKKRGSGLLMPTTQRSNSPIECSPF